MSQGTNNGFCIHCHQSKSASMRASHAIDELLNVALENSKLKEEVNGLRHELKMLTSGLPDALMRERMKVHDELMTTATIALENFQMVNDELGMKITNALIGFLGNIKKTEQETYERIQSLV